ncbi:fasciclin domain-containing protein [Pseudoalteromonas sp. Of7M-16]|uniref:fasciclin domain-containing protein n=1 Tax=Pseudoalteromonas sp. Of7M-16 TaxID=2917756 RepID=UPI001EF596F0|nr:fasciclin domain-containing protein [Pseudoalteromonas sp. Of7M-16]MCG7549550.1 fasciclin domain-containing protein [Pseudoalteromonas sp. Of7M-16]
MIVKVLAKLAIVAIVGLLSACSDDDDPVITPQPHQPENSVYDAAKAAGSFNTLVAALDATGLNATLDDTNNKFTVFAPTDAAFELLGTQAINDLLADTDTLSKILTYHVLNSEVNAETALTLAGQTADTVNGAKIALSLSGESLLINTATVTQTDIQTDNGIIHVIDAVLMPPVESTPSQNIAEVATQAGNFTTLLKAVETAGLTSALTGSDPLTVFAPTDAAFAALGTSTINTLLANPDVLGDILKQHIVSGSVDAVTAMSLNGKNATTLLGNQKSVAIDPAADMLKFAGIKVTQTDVRASNGIIHVLDAVVVGDITVPESLGLIPEVASNAGSFNTLISLLSATGLDQTLSDPTVKFTVFAPTDDAFSALGQATLDALGADTEMLKDILLYHVVSGQSVMSDAAAAIASSQDNMVTMANTDMAALSTVDSKLFIDDAVIRTANVKADNGVIHVLDKVIMPPAEKATSNKTIAQVASETDDLSTLVTALTAANLVDILSDTSAQFTVFAPTNRAFQKIPTDTLNALLADQAGLTQVLTQHLLALEAPAMTALKLNGKQVETIAKNMLDIRVVDFAGTTNSETDAVAYDANQQTLVAGKGHDKAGFTLYVFDNDLSFAQSQCNDACAAAWPPVIATQAQIANIPGLSLIARQDSQMQVAYLGRPLYLYASDTAPGDMLGSAINNWSHISLPTSGLQIEGSNVIQKDIYTANGVVHLIDTVITSVD